MSKKETWDIPRGITVNDQPLRWRPFVWVAAWLLTITAIALLGRR